MKSLDDTTIQTAAAVVLGRLRRGEGLREHEAATLIAELSSAASAWEGSDLIPRTTTNLFVDLATGVESCAHAYGGTEGQRSARYSLELDEAIRRLLALPAPWAAAGGQ